MSVPPQTPKGHVVTHVQWQPPHPEAWLPVVFYTHDGDQYLAGFDRGPTAEMIAKEEQNPTFVKLDPPQPIEKGQEGVWMTEAGDFVIAHHENPRADEHAGMVRMLLEYWAKWPSETLQTCLRRLLGHEGSEEFDHPRYNAERMHHSAMVALIGSAERCLILPLGPVDDDVVANAIRAFFAPTVFEVEYGPTDLTLTSEEGKLWISVTNQSNQEPPTISVSVNRS